MPRRKRQWFDRRTWKDAPSSVEDQTHTNASAWAAGYNAAVQMCIDEMDALYREGVEQGRWS